MTLKSNASMSEMFSMRRNGATIAQISERSGLKPMTVYQRLRRTYGDDALKSNLSPLPGPANDNNPDRVTRMSAHNGGCSTASGMMPVTLVRVPTIDGTAGLEGVIAPAQVAA